MIGVAPQVRTLVRKEWRQLRSSKQAMGTSILMPILFLLLVPQVLIAGSRAAAAHPGPVDHPPGPGAIGFAADIARDPSSIAISFLPLFVALAGLTVPIVLAIHAVVSERETRTFELLVGLPVRVSDVLRAKLLTVIGFTLALCATFLSIVIVELLVFGLATPLHGLALLLELCAAIAAGTSGAMVVGFHAHDFRTAQNVSGAVVVPMVFLSMAVAALVGGGLARPLALAALFATIATLFFAHASRQSTFEKLLR